MAGEPVNRMLVAALRYAEIGWRVFPTTGEGKRKAPHKMLGGKGSGGYHLASCDPDTIRKWWTDDPTAGIGVDLHGSGLIALDVDPRNGGTETLRALEERHGKLDSAVVQATGGGGLHLIYLRPPGASGLPGKLGAGVDLKDNGYTILTPSLHESGKRYEWVKGKSPFVAGWAMEQTPGWIANGHATGAVAVRTAVANGHIKDDDPFVEATRKVDLGLNEIRSRLMTIPADDYDLWRGVGMAIHHQFDGDEVGRDLWHEWSSTAGNYDAEALDSRWPGFAIEGKGRKPVTAAYIIKLSDEHGWKPPEDAFRRFQAALAEARGAGNKAAVLTAAHGIKTMKLDGPTREMAAGLVQEAFKHATGVRLSTQQARDLVRREETNRERPAWLADWCYCTSDDRFYNWTSRAVMTSRAFDSAHGRLLLTKQDQREGRSAPDQPASFFALNVHQIPVVQGRLYVPGEDRLFTLSGVPHVNTYTDRNVPAVPKHWTERDKMNVAIVQGHYEHLFPDERDRRILLDWICYIVQTMKRPNFACMVQGVESDGKTFIGAMIGAVIGSNNVRFLGAKTIEGAFNGWAEGQTLAVIEEIKLHGHNRYDVLNQIKPLITNAVVEIHRKGVDPYNVPNTTSYLLLTNFRDALPLTDNDSRYFILASRWQDKLSLDAFNKGDPTYYERLYNAISESPGAIRGWLLSRKISADFRPDGRAPHSVARKYMAMISKSEVSEQIEDMIAESMKPGRSNTLLDATDLISEMAGMSQGVQTSTINKLLSDAGFIYLGRFRVGSEKHRFWSKKPALFQGKDEKEVSVKIRDWLNEDL